MSDEMLTDEQMKQMIEGDHFLDMDGAFIGGNLDPPLEERLSQASYLPNLPTAPNSPSTSEKEGYNNTPDIFDSREGGTPDEVQLASSLFLEQKISEFFIEEGSVFLQEESSFSISGQSSPADYSVPEWNETPFVEEENKVAPGPARNSRSRKCSTAAKGQGNGSGKRGRGRPRKYSLPNVEAEAESLPPEQLAYRASRYANNEAVRRCRERKAQETKEAMIQMEKRNSELEIAVLILRKQVEEAGMQPQA